MAQYIEDIFFCTLDVIKKAKITVNVETQNSGCLVLRGNLNKPVLMFKAD